MIALPTPSPPLWGWSWESADGHYPSLYPQQNNYFSTCSNTVYDHETTQTTRFALADSNDHLSTSHDHLQFGRAGPDDRVMGIKKLHHNASERDRRKKMNTLYSNLRSLLPLSDQMKKMSIPSTVARVVKYIPELQQQVQQLIARKEKLLSEIGVHTNDDIRIHPTKETDDNVSLPLISLNRLGNGELVIQIPAQNGQDCPFMSEILLNFKEDGLLLLNASSFQSLGSTMLFYNLHFQVKEDLKVDCEDLNKKIISLLKRNGDGVS